MPRFIVILTLLLVFNSTCFSDSNEIRIGVIGPFSGVGAPRGDSARIGLELALKKIKQSNFYKDKEIKLIYQDVPLDHPAKAPSALSQLVNMENVHAIIGPMGSTISLSVVPLVKRYKIPIIVHTASALGVTKDNKYVFRIWATAIGYANTISENILLKFYPKIKKIALISAIQDNAIDLKNEFSNRIDSNEDLSLVFNEEIAASDLDFKPYLLKIKQSGAELIIANLFVNQAGVFAKQMKELNIETILLSGPIINEAEVALSEGALEGVYFPRTLGISKGTEGVAALASLASPDSAAAAHDALLVLSQAIQHVGLNNDKIVNYIQNNRFHGAMGEFGFGPQGDASIPLGVFQVKNGEIVLVK